MNRRYAAEAMLRLYGQAVSQGSVRWKAILRPLGFKAGEKLGLPAGSPDGLHYLYTGPAAHKLTAGNTVISAGETYETVRAETVLLNGEELYVRAVLNRVPAVRVLLEAGGTQVAAADFCSCEMLRDAAAPVSWGESVPAGTAPGAFTCRLTLKNIRPAEGADLFALSDFTVTVTGKSKKTVYSGCCWQNLAAAGGTAGETLKSMTVLAASWQQEEG